MLTPLQEAEAKIKGLESVISHLRWDLERARFDEARAQAAKHSRGADIHEVRARVYECEHQHQPLADLLDGDEAYPHEDYERDRARILKAIRYVVFGRRDW